MRHRFKKPQKCNRSSLYGSLIGKNAYLTFAVLITCLSTPSFSQKPNVIFIKADDQRADFMGYAGNPWIQTPNINKLAEDGTIFTNAFATSPICSPSRGSFFTGRWERSHGASFGTPLPNASWENETWLSVLRASGYFTGYVGKNHVKAKDLNAVPGYFNYYFGHTYGHIGFYPKSKNAVFKLAQVNTQIELLLEGALDFLDPANSTLTKPRLSQIPERDASKPFALTVNFNLPHFNGVSTMRFRKDDDDLYKEGYRDIKNKIVPPDNFIPATNTNFHRKIPKTVNGKPLINASKFADYDYAKLEDGRNKVMDNLKEYMVRASATTTGIDRFVGAIRDKLKELNLDKNTIIIYSSDHGIMLGEQGLRGKAILYEPSVKIPLVIYDPREPARVKTSDALVANIDVPVTILDLLGVENTAPMQGRSMVPIIKKQETPWRQDILLENLFVDQGYTVIESVRSKCWKYIRYHPYNDTRNYTSNLDKTIGMTPLYEELYNLCDDPAELNNLAGNASYKDTLKSYQDRVVELLAAVRAGKGDSLTASRPGIILNKGVSVARLEHAVQRGQIKNWRMFSLDGKIISQGKWDNSNFSRSGFPKTDFVHSVNARSKGLYIIQFLDNRTNILGAKKFIIH